MTPYVTARALRMALEHRLLLQSEATGISLDRLRRRVLFERIVARLHAAEPGCWVVKGGMALELRLRDAARLTKDLDLGLRARVHDGLEIEERLVEAMSADPDGDRFVISARPLKRMATDEAGQSTWRSRLAATLDGRPFGGMQLDVSPRTHEIEATDHMVLSNALDFAGITAPTVEVVSLHRHAAEKFHGMLQVFGHGENTRVRDLVDLVILAEHGLLDPPAVAAHVRAVWTAQVQLPTSLPPLPGSWPERYERMAAEQGLGAATFGEAVVVVESLWAAMFPTGG